MSSERVKAEIVGYWSDGYRRLPKYRLAEEERLVMPRALTAEQWREKYRKAMNELAEERRRTREMWMILAAIIKKNKSELRVSAREFFNVDLDDELIQWEDPETGERVFRVKGDG